MALRELNKDLNEHIDEATTQEELKQIKDLLNLKISSLENLVATNNLLEESEYLIEEDKEEEVIKPDSLSVGMYNSN